MLSARAGSLVLPVFVRYGLRFGLRRYSPASVTRRHSGHNQKSAHQIIPHPHQGHCSSTRLAGSQTIFMSDDEKWAAAAGVTVEQWREMVQESILESRNAALPQVDALLQAGWRYELPEIVNRKDDEPPSKNFTEPWQWYWRAPSKRKGRPGRRYLSTNQAFSALTRQSGVTPSPM